HLVEKFRLVGHAPGLGLDDVALTKDAYAFFAQASSRGAEVSGACSEVGSEAEVDSGQRIWSAARTTRVICRTSCTRTMSAPRSTPTATVAAVPSSRSVTAGDRLRPHTSLRIVAPAAMADSATCCL